MGILSSLYTGISGLQTQGDVLGVYSDNIANASTTGFKASRPEFEDLVFRSITGLSGITQIGSGTKLSNVTTVHSQGTLVPTESVTDLAINGSGFFVLKGVNGESYTRNGAFHFDKQGEIVSVDNDKLMGFKVDEKTGKVSSTLGPIVIDRAVIQAKPTSKVMLNMNLDLQAAKIEKFDIKNPDETSSYSTSVTVYDSAGTPHVATVFFNKLSDGQWSWRATVKGNETTSGKEGELVECANGKLIFDENGYLKDQIINKSSFNFNNGAKIDQFVKFDFGPDLAHGGNGLSVTQFGTASQTYKCTNDGYTSGAIQNMSFADDGTLLAQYTNGENIKIAKVAIAKFENPDGLSKAGNSKFKKTLHSGEANIGEPLSGGRGKVLSRHLESSTTDIATEFINLMEAQRNFQANSKVITTSDDMLQSVLNLKRS